MLPTTMTLSANLLKIHFLEFYLTNISLTGSQFHYFEFAYSLLLFLPSTNIPLFEKSNVLLSLVINNSPMNRFPISNSTYVQISCVKYIPLLCRIWPVFIQKSSLFYQQSLGMIQRVVPNFLKSPYLCSLDVLDENEVHLGSLDLAFSRTKKQGNKAKLWDF